MLEELILAQEEYKNRIEEISKLYGFPLEILVGSYTTSPDAITYLNDTQECLHDHTWVNDQNELKRAWTAKRKPYLNFYTTLNK